MTTVKIKRQGDSIVSVSCSGHCDFEEHGYDIVCASLSSIVQTAVLGIMMVLGINAKFSKDDEAGELYFELPELDEKKREQADIILDTMFIGVENLHETYSDFIELETI